MPTITQTVFHKSGKYTAGDVLPADHPLVRSAPDLFADDEGVVEQATAGPGDIRSTKRPAKRAARSKV